MTEEWRRLLAESIEIWTARAHCGDDTFEIRGTRYRYILRAVNDEFPDIGIGSRERLVELSASVRPATIGVVCLPDEKPSMETIVEEIKRDPRVRARLH